MVEVDETVLCRRGVIRDPTFCDDDEVRDTVWIVGISVKFNKSNFYVTHVQNRTVTHPVGSESKIGVCSVLVSDGYPSYPGVASNLNLVHKAVKYSVGFVNEEGDHTNTIENLCAQMK